VGSGEASVKLRRVTVGCLVAGITLVAAHSSEGTPGEEGLVSSAEEVSPILIGTKVPDGALKTGEGQATTLGELLAGDPGVLVFYRGHW
jgi:hypothetical protein